MSCFVWDCNIFRMADRNIRYKTYGKIGIPFNTGFMEDQHNMAEGGSVP